MEEVIVFLLENEIVYLATTDASGNPRVRPFRLRYVKDNKLWFCTSNGKDVYEQLKNNPQVELCVCAEDHSWIRINGKAVFEDNREVREACLKNPRMKKSFDSADDPAFEVFYLAGAKAAITAADGKSVQEFDLDEHIVG